MIGIASYRANETSDIDSLVNEHAALVKRIAYHLGNRLPACVQIEDLIQAGMVGLLESIRSYDASRGATFKTYAGIRIRGAMLDEVRRSDWTPRSVHKKARLVARTIRDIENATGRDARASEVAERLNLQLDEYYQVLQDSMNSRIFSIEELAQAGLESLEECGEIEKAPIEGLTQAGFKTALADAIAGLPERERLVISLYYDEELNLREIGEAMGISESRVCQINSQAMIRLRARMSDWLDKEP
ncbi:MAG: RNA polymerase sigma factor FliA [Gammaproteobacteria bacterium]